MTNDDDWDWKKLLFVLARCPLKMSPTGAGKCHQIVGAENFLLRLRYKYLVIKRPPFARPVYPSARSVYPSAQPV